MSYRALLRRLLGGKPRPAPKPAFPAMCVHRGECEFSAGTAFVGSDCTVIRKLSPAEAARCFGVVQGGR